MAPTTSPMASPSQNLTPRLYHAVALGPAVMTFLAAVATFLLIGITVGGAVGLVIAQGIGLLGVPVAVAFAHTGGTAALGTAAPRAIAALGAVLVGATFWYLNLRIALPVAERLGGTDELTAFQARYIDDQPLAPLLLALAVVPALCEELLCRGLLARAIAGRAPRWVAVAASAAAFSLLHLSLPRALPTFTLGLVLGWAALASGSVWTAVAIHAVNNAAALLIAGGALGPVSAAIAAHPNLATAAAGVGTATGLALVAISTNVTRTTPSPKVASSDTFRP